MPEQAEESVDSACEPASDALEEIRTPSGLVNSSPTNRLCAIFARYLSSWAQNEPSISGSD